VTAELEQAVLAAIDDERIVEDLESLVRIPSVDGTACTQDEWLRDHPVTVTWPGGRATDEHVAVAEVLHSARAYALLAVRRCAVGGE
jgi:hypothetical protein